MPTDSAAELAIPRGPVHNREEAVVDDQTLVLCTQLNRSSRVTVSAHDC